MVHNEHSISLTVEAREAVAYMGSEGLMVCIEGDICCTIKQWNERNFGSPVTVLNLDTETLRAIAECLDNVDATESHTIEVRTYEGTFTHKDAEAVPEDDMLLIKDSKGNTVAAYRYWDYWTVVSEY